MRPVLEERQRVWVKYPGSPDLEAEIKQFSTSLRKMVRKGIPHQYRGDVRSCLPLTPPLREYLPV